MILGSKQMIWLSLSSCNVLKKLRENVQSKQLLKFVKGLNDSFEFVRLKVLLTVPLPDMNAVFNMAINHEAQQGCGANQVMSQVMCTQKDSAQGVSLSDATQHELPASFVTAITQNPIAGFTNDQYEKLMYLINNTQINAGNGNGTVKPLVNQILVDHAIGDKVIAWKCDMLVYQNTFKTWGFRFRGN
ncbi:hypothetical protein M9H77_11313 [Catharanthus roseus]|uniref:Uncharacterized protein n=1 Tax=Catharanthus roseus TaxID=4058 RepID=A0ACC0BE82_CATRO|nr:hypothetical protein M9H77_11313 [Catharanthus roseus]